MAILLQQRASPNARLRSAFLLTNTFVTEDLGVHSAFVKHAKSLMTNAPYFQHLVTAVVDEYLDEARNHSTGARYDTLVEVITLKVILDHLFHVDHATITYEDALFVAQGINELWQQSKTPGAPPSSLLDGINSRLRRWMPEYENPLDFIIPTYETMWRVIAVTVVLVSRNEEIHSAFSTFLDNPSRSQFQDWPAKGPSVEAVIRESMRLHPPTRRISRAVNITPSIPFIPSFIASRFSRSCICVANIGEVQRNPNIWGPNADIFDPMRHRPEQLTEEQEQSMLSFGYGRLRCVAKDWAPQVAAMIVAGILSRVGNRFQIIADPDAGVGGRVGWNKWSVEVVDLRTNDSPQ